MKTTQELKELLYKNKTVADQQPDAIAEANVFCEGYKAFLNAAKTEREAAAYSVQLLNQAGYKPFVPGMALNAVDKDLYLELQEWLKSRAKQHFQTTNPQEGESEA